MQFQNVVVGKRNSKVTLVGIVNGEGFFYPNRFYASQEEAEEGMYNLAVSEINRVNSFYESRRKTNEDGSLAKPGRRSTADMETIAMAQSWVDSFAEAQKEKEAISRFKATLTPEQLAVLG